MSTAILAFTLIASDAASSEAERHLMRGDVAVVAGPHYGDGSLSPTDEQIAAARSVLPEVTGEHQVDVVAQFGGWSDHLHLVPDRDPVASEIAGGIIPSRVGLVTPALRSLLGIGDTDPTTVVLNLDPADAYGQPIGSRFDAKLGRDGRATVDVSVVVAPTTLSQPFPELLVTEDAAEQLGLAPLATFHVLELSSPVTMEHARTVWDVETAELPFTVGLSVPSEDLSSTTVLLLVGGLGVLLALAIAAATTALAATESDHDLRTMAAVGADPRLRPRFRALQAGFHVALGGMLAIPAGLLLAFVFQRDGPWSTISVPVVAIASFVALSPVIVAMPFLLFSRSSPSQLSARRPA